MELIEVVQHGASQIALTVSQGLTMSIRKLLTSVAVFGATAIAQSAAGVEDLEGPGTDLYDKDLSACPGYVASNQHETRSGFYADLSLAGEACNVYGTDLPDLKLEVEYQTSDRLHVKIKDSNNTVYQVPDELFPRPGFGQWCSPKDSKLQFNFNADPFSFSVSRTDTGEVLFDTTGEKLVFESQYVYIKTHLPEEPHLYGLGEHSDSFMLNSTNYTRTIYTRDSYGTPQGENLYGECRISAAIQTRFTYSVLRGSPHLLRPPWKCNTRRVLAQLEWHGYLH